MRLSVDVIIVEKGKILLVRRAHDPCEGMWALPGGIVDEDETVEAAAIREVREETGLDVELKSLVGVFSDPNRSPGKRTVAVSFSAVKTGGKEAVSEESHELRWFPVSDLPNLAFDHIAMVKKFTDYSV